MKITIFDLGKNKNNKLIIEEVINYYHKINKNAVFSVNSTNDIEIKNCIGCWSCWWKTPGKCAIKDKSEIFYKEYINSDEVVILFDTVNGFIDGNGKTFLDRLIQHFLPYIKLRNGECGHLKRYDTYPVFNFCFEKNGLNKEEIEVIRNYLARTAYHFQSPCREVVYDNNVIQFIVTERPDPRPELLAKEVTERHPAGKWVIYNGSPRGERSNSKLIIQKMIQGMNKQGIEHIEVRNLIQEKEHVRWAQEFGDAKNYLFVFPLYVHAMPGIVMKFFGRLKPVNDRDVHMAFFVQSGFPETSQSYYLRPYLEILTKRLGVSYDGTMIKGGVEGIQMKPEKANKQLFEQMIAIGEIYAEKGIMDPVLKKEYEKMEYMSKSSQILFSVFSLTGLTNFYWDYHLKKNGAYKKRYAKPYLE
jgi:multimeric flavodoxin WrbA